MLALVLALAAATPLEAPTVADAPPRVDDVDADADDDTATPDGPAPPPDTPMWGPMDDDEDDEDDDAGEPSRPATRSPPGAGSRDEVRLPLRHALGVVATAAAVPVVVGASTAVVSLVVIAAFFPWVRYGVFLIVPAIGFGAGVLGAAAGAELGVALFGDTRDHHWVGLGSTTGAVIGLILVWTGYRAGIDALAYDDAVFAGAGALVLGSAAGTGLVLVARHADLPALPWAASGALIGVGSAALGVGAAFSLLGPVSNDSLAGPDEAVAPAVMVLGAATLAAGFLFSPHLGTVQARGGLVEVGATLRDPWGAAE